MNEAEVVQYITRELAGVDSVVDSGNSFFFYNPDPNIPPGHMFPFATLMTNELNDQFSNLSRPSVYRLNIGVSKQTFRSLFGSPELPAYGDMAPGPDSSYDFDFTALDELLPHPVYGRQYWMSVLNPSAETFETKVKPLLAEAYQMAVRNFDKKAART
jgi:hypothetical protein